MRSADVAKLLGVGHVHVALSSTKLAAQISRFDDAIAREDLEMARSLRSKLWRAALELIAAPHPGFAAVSAEPRELARWAVGMDAVVGELKVKLRKEGKPA